MVVPREATARPITARPITPRLPRGLPRGPPRGLPRGCAHHPASGEGSSSEDGEDGGFAPPSLPARPWTLAGWDAPGGEAPYRRLHTDGVVRPTPVRAWWGTGLGLHTGDSGGGGAPSLLVGGRSARQLDLSDRCSVGYFSEQERRSLTIAPVSQSLGWRQSVGTVARTCGGRWWRCNPARGWCWPGLAGQSLVDGALQGGRRPPCGWKARACATGYRPAGWSSTCTRTAAEGRGRWRGLGKVVSSWKGGLGWEPPQCRRPRLIHSTDGRRTEVMKEETL